MRLQCSFDLYLSDGAIMWLNFFLQAHSVFNLNSFPYSVTWSSFSYTRLNMLQSIEWHAQNLTTLKVMHHHLFVCLSVSLSVCFKLLPNSLWHMNSTFSLRSLAGSQEYSPGLKQNVFRDLSLIHLNLLSRVDLNLAFRLRQLGVVSVAFIVLFLKQPQK